MPSSASGQDLDTARRLAAAVGLNLPEGRLSAFAASLAANFELARPLLSIDYGPTEPASRFRAPPGAR